MVGYWGQNSTGPSVGDPSKYEKPLKEVCQTTKYDILNLAFLNIFWDSRNEGKSKPRLPSCMSKRILRV